MSGERTRPHDAVSPVADGPGPVPPDVPTPGIAESATAGPPGGGRFRVVWQPGSDRLVGICHCGAEHPAEDPNLVWRWLLSHPDHESSRP